MDKRRNLEKTIARDEGENLTTLYGEAFEKKELKREAFAAGAIGFVAKDHLHKLETILISELEH